MKDFAGRSRGKRNVFTIGKRRKSGWPKALMILFILMCAVFAWILMNETSETRSNAKNNAQNGNKISLDLNASTSSSSQNNKTIINNQSVQAIPATQNNPKAALSLADLYSNSSNSNTANQSNSISLSTALSSSTTQSQIITQPQTKSLAELMSGESEISEDLGIDEQDKSALAELVALAEQEEAAKIPANFKVYDIIAGDTLSGIFQKKLNLPYNNITKLLAADKNALSNIRPGQSIQYRMEIENFVGPISPISTMKLKSFLAELILKDKKSIHHFTLNDDQSFSYKKTKLEIVWKQQYYQGVIQSTLGSAINDIGLGIGITAQVANVMGERLDFRRQVRIGDEFAILVNHGYREGKKVANKVQAVYYKGSKADLIALIHKDGRFYDPKGRSLQRAFMRHPHTGKYRMSSPFGMRLHPIQKVMKMHNGTDYAMNTGTKVVSTSEGTVITSAYHKYNGNYVVVKHNEKYTTKYLHLSKRTVEKGDRVSMGERIGLSGNTGSSTGPHLHYILQKNGKSVNSLKTDLPTAKKLSNAETATLNANTGKWQTQLTAMLTEKVNTATAE
jgi:murein DD-endopeptidase